MPSLMIVQGTIRDSNNFLDVKGSEKAIDFTMSKFKASSPMRHPLYQQFFGNNNNVNDMSLERNEHQHQQHHQLQSEEQGKL